jgi:hypothetical protein
VRVKLIERNSRAKFDLHCQKVVAPTTQFILRAALFPELSILIMHFFQLMVFFFAAFVYFFVIVAYCSLLSFAFSFSLNQIMMTF